MLWDRLSIRHVASGRGKDWGLARANTEAGESGDSKGLSGGVGGRRESCLGRPVAAALAGAATVDVVPDLADLGAGDRAGSGAGAAGQ